MRLFHCGTNFEQIAAGGLFDGVFASSSPKRSHGNDCAMIYIRDCDIAESFDLNDSADAYNYASAVLRLPDAVIEAVFSDDSAAYLEAIGSDDCQDGWEMQRLRGEVAAHLGYKAVRMNDEYGTSYLCLPGCKIRWIK